MTEVQPCLTTAAGVAAKLLEGSIKGTSAAPRRAVLSEQRSVSKRTSRLSSSLAETGEQPKALGVVQWKAEGMMHTLCMWVLPRGCLGAPVLA